MNKIIIKSLNALGSEALLKYNDRIKKLSLKEKIVFRTMYDFKLVKDDPQVVISVGLKHKLLSPESACNVIIEGLKQDFGLSEGVDFSVSIKYDE